jgi:hypothetical protein
MRGPDDDALSFLGGLLPTLRTRGVQHPRFDGPALLLIVVEKFLKLGAVDGPGGELLRQAVDLGLDPFDVFMGLFRRRRRGPEGR